MHRSLHLGGVASHHPRALFTRVIAQSSTG